MTGGEVDDFESHEKEFSRMYSIYKTQDLDTLYQLMTESPEMMCSQEFLRDRRNRNWIPVMESVMKNLTTFFAVGAGHLARSQGVLELLEMKDLRNRE